jgi:nucleotide-binding universal stress UspA family protein
VLSTALIGLDRSTDGDPVLAAVPDLRHWGIERLLLAHVPRIDLAAGGDEDALAETQAWLGGCAAPLADLGFEVDVVVGSGGAPARSLVAMAEGSADLLVVGARSHRPGYDLLIGSVAKQVTRRARLPVLLVRHDGEVGDPQLGGRRSGMLRCVLLATDLSAASRAAEHLAIDLAARAGIVDVLTVVAGDPASPAALGEARDDRQAEILAAVVAAGAQGERIVDEGDAATSIAALAEDGYSLIIVGKHGRSGIADRWIGATAGRVSEIARRPVLLVPGELGRGARG